MDYFSATEHFKFYHTLSKLVSLGKISSNEMEILLTKSGLTKIEDYPVRYRTEDGAILSMNPEKLKQL